MNANSEQKLPFLPFSRPGITEQEIAEVARVLRSGWITTGPKCAELETLFCEVLGCQHAISLTSATAGMHLLLHALGIGPGDEVITPSMTWVSTLNLISLSGAKPVLVDVDRDTLMTTAELIEPYISERTRLIIPVHFAGAALDLSALRTLAGKYGVPLVEDAAHAIGTHYGSERIGQTGTSIFSMHPIKNITTGEGGMLCTDDEQLAIRIRQLRFHGLGVDAFDRETRARAPQAEVLEPGFKYNLPDINAILGVGQLKRLEEINTRRTELADLYHQLLAGVPEVMPLSLPDYPIEHAWHLFIVRLDTGLTGISRAQFMQQLKELGIGTGLHFRAAHTQKYYRDNLSLVDGQLSNTEWNSERICSLPLFPDMLDADVHRVVAAIKKVVRGVRT